MSNSLEQASTYKVIKPHVSDLLWRVALPVLTYDARDHELWTSDPEEYVRGQLDPMDALVDPRTSSSEFIITLLKVGVSEGVWMSQGSKRCCRSSTIWTVRGRRVGRTAWQSFGRPSPAD